jgi:hypothetical protein
VAFARANMSEEYIVSIIMFYPDDGGDTFLKNRTVSHPRRWNLALV